MERKEKEGKRQNKWKNVHEKAEIYWHEEDILTVHVAHSG